jgi:metallo-beta-lactamase family protein
MADVQVAIHGAGKTVTGSCYEVRWGDHRILVDCGLFQDARKRGNGAG